MPVGVALCGFEGPPEDVSRHFPVAMARGKYLFPFRTEQLSPSAPMVLGPHGPGRVGRRRFFHHEPPSGRLVVFGGRVGVRSPRAMLLTVLVAVAFVGLCILGGLFGAESRPDFLDPRTKHRPFVAPFRWR